MKNKIFVVLLALGSAASASGSIALFQDDFSSDSLESNYVTQGVNYNSTAQSVTILRGYSGGGNFLQVSQALNLDTGGSTQLTIAFDYAFGSATYGSGFTVEYNDNSGTGWQVIATIDYTGTNANDNGTASNPYAVTISEGATYSFTDAAVIRLKGNSSEGGKGYHIDNLILSVDSAQEPTKGTVIMISSVGGWLALFSGLFLWNENKRSRRRI